MKVVKKETRDIKEVEKSISTRYSGKLICHNGFCKAQLDEIEISDFVFEKEEVFNLMSEPTYYLLGKLTCPVCGKKSELVSLTMSKKEVDYIIEKFNLKMEN